MATVVKKKNCKRCHRDKPFGDFPDSPHSKDGKLGFCSGCWSRKMEDASTKRYAKKKRKPKIGRPKGSRTGAKNGHPVIVQAANDALKAAGSIKEKFLVRADDGDLAEFGSEEKALRQAMEWKMSGFAVTVWRQCEFEMVLRIVG